MKFTVTLNNKIIFKKKTFPFKKKNIALKTHIIHLKI